MHGVIRCTCSSIVVWLWEVGGEAERERDRESEKKNGRGTLKENQSKHHECPGSVPSTKLPITCQGGVMNKYIAI